MTSATYVNIRSSHFKA
uniref:Uncharacterized protein n=1 Tax=Arundo donax TaxID=35708 RepID=A0A0A9AJJ3_ARUDO